jgi:hypothetical protein
MRHRSRDRFPARPVAQLWIALGQECLGSPGLSHIRRTPLPPFQGVVADQERLLTAVLSSLRSSHKVGRCV